MVGLIVATAVVVTRESPATEKLAYDFWLTTGDKSSLLQKQEYSVPSVETIAGETILVEPEKTFQTIDGFGYALTGGSAWLIQQKLNPTQRESLLKELFSGGDAGLGVSYLRISIGASDLNDHVFTYNDLPAGETDFELKKFSVHADESDLIPLLKQILKINPNVTLMGSPWSAPAWMKTNGSLKGGSLRSDCYEVFAAYFVRYIQEMKKQGIPVDAVTIQNEPENPKNNPSMVMTAEEQANFVKNNLGPAFAKAGIKTKIIVFDHNCDHPNYPISILDDKDAKKYIDGSAFHLYLGEIDALSTTHEAHPDRNVYFTEQWTSPHSRFSTDLTWHVKNLMIGAPRNWSRNVLEWNLAADPQYQPHTSNGGCDSCLGALTIGDSITRNVSYYIIGHASKFVPPGSVRIASSSLKGLPNVAYKTPDGKNVLLVANEDRKTKSFTIKTKEKEITATLPGGAVGTILW